MVTLISADHVSCKYTQLAQCQCYSNSWFSSQESVRLPRFGSAAQGLQVPSSDLNAVIYLELSDGDAATLVPLFVKYLKKLFPGAIQHKKAFLAKHWIIHSKAYYLRWPRSFATRANSMSDWVT